jgi:hypothetical protein
MGLLLQLLNLWALLPARHLEGIPKHVRRLEHINCGKMTCLAVSSLNSTLLTFVSLHVLFVKEAFPKHTMQTALSFTTLSAKGIRFRIFPNPTR